jgi:hypothetical protein
MSDRLSLIIGSIGLSTHSYNFFIYSKPHKLATGSSKSNTVFDHRNISTVPGFLHINLTGKLLNNRYKIIATGSVAAFIIIYMVNQH